ncbi:major royal jelly protein 2-like, partial [Copidosoma floridanum]|uniref:major royal jelly protein 2-like n=1 Tax=Copidosoma floridanum TaxID=29053 RepID=UPI0006C9AA06
MAFSSQGTLFFGLTKENAIGCYNRYRELNKTNIGIVAQDYFLTKKYDPTSVIPMDVDRDQAGRVFVSFPRIRGVPATLGTVTNITGQWGPLIKPYPDWSWFQFNHCNTLQNVYRIEIDKCNRLWVLDTGYKGWWSKTSYCPQKLVVFDLNTDKHIRTIEIPNHIARDKNGDSLLSTPVVETEGPRCENTT